MAETRFLIIAADFRPQPGGRADYIDNLARGLISNGHPTKVLAVVQAHKEERLAFLQSYEAWVIPFPMIHDERPRNLILNKWVSVLEIGRCLNRTARRVLDRTSFFRASAGAVARLERVLEEEVPSVVVFGHLDMRLYPFALCLLERGLPYGILAHGLDFPRRQSRVNETVRRGLLLRGATWIAANSHYTKSLLADWSIPDCRTRVVYPPIAEEAILRSAELGCAQRGGSELKLVTLCRLVKGKGVDIVLRALKILNARGIPFRYTIGGDGVERGALETLACKLEMGDRVRFVGYVTGEEKWRLLKNGDVFVLTSRPEPTWVEGFGIAFIEAAAFGLPAVATREAGIPEAVLDGETGTLVGPESPEELAEVLTLFYRNPEIRNRMGRAAMERARSQFSPATVAARFQEEISKCAS